ncbi:MAG: tetratricopeptide repeat protein [Gammaproteobacteria bacterium]|nr:tetratricopeptide repeat protein [Rhodocyclaceae bacterium]MBU3909794.1 tetratricopeptide repeat protein [Gammaproteobacteria bacterium]MBU3988456.1 tetratricopeptide repeat protein [Gammaproteobacteria bacterium]MBU4005327.1 tetratricopeptide repeat protein [Gammaproteobacteria bacterium]MBU4022505.1 tetratricopeptide repeat protein [Gammaproteobacteria bacterium]
MSILPALPTAASSTTFRFRLSAQAFVLALGLSVVSLTALPVRADSYSEASQLLKSGQHAEALKQVNRHLSAKPKDAQGRFLKGIILTGMNKQKEAIEVFQKLTEDYPDLPEPYNNLAVIYAQQKQYDKAKQALELAIRTHPAYATAHENLGDIYSRLASQAYGKALQIDSSNASAQTKLAMISDLVDGAKAGKGKAAESKPAAPSTPVTPVKPPAATPVTPPTPVVIASADTKPAPAPVARPAEVKPVPAPVVAPALAPAPKAEPVKAVDVNSEITAAVDGWLAAWSKKDVSSYLAHYAKDFQTSDGQSRKEWEEERTQRVGKPGKIDVSRDKLSIKIEGDKATVRFRQGYKSATFNSNSTKTLVLVKRDGKWLIQQERVGG